MFYNLNETRKVKELLNSTLPTPEINTQVVGYFERAYKTIRGTVRIYP
jgi:hypothetical protein